MKNIKIAALLSCIISSSALATTLSEALISTYQNNPELIAAREKLKATDEQMYEAISGFLPSIQYKATKTYNKQDTKSPSTSEQYAAAYNEQENLPNKKISPWASSKSRQSSLLLKQNIFNGGKDFMKIQIAKYTIESGRSDLIKTEQTIFLNTIQAYLDAIQKKQVLDISKENVTFYDRKLEGIRQEAEAGVKTRANLAEAEAAKANAYTKLAQATGEYESALATYTKMTGLTAENLSLEKSLTSIPENQVEFLQFALKNNPDLVSVKFQQKAADAGVFLNAAVMLPSVDFEGSINKQKTHSRSESASHPYTNSKSISLGVSVPIYQKGLEYSGTRKASAAAANLKYVAKNAKAQITQMTTQTWSQYITSKEAVKSAQEAVNAGTIALEGIEQGYQEGVNSLIDLLNTRENLYQYQISLAQAQEQMEISRYSIASLMGKLTAIGLSLPTKFYNPSANYDKVKLQLVGF
jgi:outer membrane protein